MTELRIQAARNFISEVAEDDWGKALDVLDNADPHECGVDGVVFWQPFENWENCDVLIEIDNLYSQFQLVYEEGQKNSKES